MFTLTFFQSSGAVVTESQTYKKRSDFLSNDDYAVYVRENIQVSRIIRSYTETTSLLIQKSCIAMAFYCPFSLGGDDG